MRLLGFLHQAWYLMETWGHFFIMAPLIGVATYLMGDWHYASVFAALEIATFVHSVKIKQYDTSHPMADDRTGTIVILGAVAVAVLVGPSGLIITPETGFRVLVANHSHVFFLGFALWWTSDFIHDVRRGAIKSMLDVQKDNLTFVGWIILMQVLFPIGVVWLGQMEYQLMMARP